MTTTTIDRRPAGTARTADMLRRLADALDASNPDNLHVYVGVTDMNLGAPRTARVATVDALAALLDLSAEPTKGEGDYWYHQASLSRSGFHLRVRTDIESPKDRCACGAACTHSFNTARGGRP